MRRTKPPPKLAGGHCRSGRRSSGSRQRRARRSIRRDAQLQVASKPAPVKHSSICGDTIVRSTLAGRVGDRAVRVGQFVQPGTRLMTIVPVQDLLSHRELQGDPDRSHARRTAGDDPASTPCRATELHGTVDSFSPGTGAQFALLPPQNATGNFTKIVQRVPVRIRIDDERADSAARCCPAFPSRCTSTRVAPAAAELNRARRSVARAANEARCRASEPNASDHGLDRRDRRRPRRADGDARHFHHELRAAPDSGLDRRHRHRRHLDFHGLSHVGDRDDPADRVAHACFRAARRFC